MRRVAPLTVAALGLATLPLGACGGDDGPSREEFARAANAICRDIEREGSEITRAAPDTLAEIVTFSSRAERAIGGGIDRLQRLETPSGEDGERARRFVAALARQVEGEFLPALRDLRDAARERDSRALRAAARRLRDVEGGATDRLAQEVGATACAE